MATSVVGASLLWQYQYGSKWITHSQEALEIINSAFNKQQKSVTVTEKEPNKAYIVNFETMVQKHKVSKRQQRIRCGVFGEGFYTWQWKDDDDDWISYSPTISIELEVCFKHGKILKFCKKYEYEVDLNTFKQKNEKTGNVRDVQRVKLEGEFNSLCLTRIALDFATYMLSRSQNGNHTSENDPEAKRPKLENSTLSDREHTSYVLKGKAPIDPECRALIDKAHVYYRGSEVFDAVLNLTDVSTNSNEFYHMQILKLDTQEIFFVWFRWGRVGSKGHNGLHDCGDSFYKAEEMFSNRFFSKTSNLWENKNNFCKYQGKYDLIKMDYGSQCIPKLPVEVSRTCSLNPKVQSVLKMISNIEDLTNMVVSLNFDVKKLPLGKLSKEQIHAGYVALKGIEKCMADNELGAKLHDANNLFYSSIPHNFGMKVPPIINSSCMLREKLDLLEALSHVQMAVEIKKTCPLEDQLTNLYEAIQCDLKVLSPDDQTYDLIKKALLETHGPTHTNYTLKVLDIFEVNKKEENERFTDLGTNYLLWHGSPITNFLRILKRGLCIAPPEAPSTGYMFGKGIYFANVSSKSANYCQATKKNDEGLLLLCQVSLGNKNLKVEADYDAQFDCELKGYDSVKGVGNLAPFLQILISKRPVTYFFTGRPKKWCHVVRDLMYSEYVVYNPKQVIMKYLVRVKFCFN